MESELSADEERNAPPLPIKTYQWEDLRRAREAGGYPWTHLLKVPLEGEITADDIIRSTTPRRSMSREFSKSRTHSPEDHDMQKILNLDSSPGSSRKHDEEGKDEGVHIPNFSKEISLDLEDDTLNQTAPKPPVHLVTPVEVPKNISPKSILKRRAPEQQYIGLSETREKTKCCHPLVNKIKHLADRTLHKLEKSENEKSPSSKRKKNHDVQEIRQLKSSPGAVRRQKFSAIKLGDSDEVSKTISADTPPPRKKKEHIYEDIDESKGHDTENIATSSPDTQNNFVEEHSKDDSNGEKKSNASCDPSLVAEDTQSLKNEEHIMEKLHKKMDIDSDAVSEGGSETGEPRVEEEPQNKSNVARPNQDSYNITITEITDDESANNMEQSSTIPIEASPSPSPREIERKRKDEFQDNDWSKPSSDHEYEIIEKPPPNIIYTAPSVDEKPTMVKTDDELSSTTSLERKYLQHTSDEEEPIDDKENYIEEKTENVLSAEALQKDIEDRFFVNTPSTVSRTECEVSTSQVDSSALENLPLKRDSRTKNGERVDNKLQQRFKESTGKIKTQAGKLKTKINNFKMPERPKFKMPERPKFSMPDKSKFSLPDRPRMKNFNIREKLSLGDRRKFSLPERPKFNVPDFPKFRMPERPKINFPSLGRKKDQKMENDITESSSDLQNTATVEFEAKTYPRLFSKKKKTPLPKTSSSPTLNREDTPPPTFTFTRVKKTGNESTYHPNDSEQPREYGNIDEDDNFVSEEGGGKQFEATYDFDKVPAYLDEDTDFKEASNSPSMSALSPINQEYTHINEINNDEFFVRPRGISRENIQVREYLSDEIRQAFQTPKNVLVTMGNDSTTKGDEHMYANDIDIDNDLIDDNENMKYSTEDINERDDGYYTFPPVRPSRAKRKKKETESIKYIDDSVTASMQFSEVDLGMSEDQLDNQMTNEEMMDDGLEESHEFIQYPSTDLRSIHEYANDDPIEYSEQPVQAQTLPMPPKRKKKFGKQDQQHSSLSDFKRISASGKLEELSEDIIVYRTEHEYTIPLAETTTDPSPAPPRRTRSRSSREPSLYDDDRTSRGAESLTLDTNLPPADDISIERESRHESPGYATVDKGISPPTKAARRSKSKTPPVRRRKSNSSERKYYTVGGGKKVAPDRPPRKKSSASLMTLDSFAKRSISGDFTQYVEIDEPQTEDAHKDLKSGEILSKMKDRPLPPPPRPPRDPKRKKKSMDDTDESQEIQTSTLLKTSSPYVSSEFQPSNVVEIEVSTQTDPLPEDVDFDLDENLNISMSSSLRDLVNEDSIMGKSSDKATDGHGTRPTSRSEKSLRLSDPKISDLSKPSGIGRTSPTVILVEKRVSSPTRINERDEVLTEASLTVQPIDIDEEQIPEVPPLPKSRGPAGTVPQAAKEIPTTDRALERVSDVGRDIQLDNLVTQRLQVRDLDVGRLNVSELQASKILVSDIEGMTLHVNELDSKSGHISVSGIEFSQSVIDEIAKKFAEISTVSAPQSTVESQPQDVPILPKPENKEEETQTETSQTEIKEEIKMAVDHTEPLSQQAPPTHSPTPMVEESIPPLRPPPPDLTPLLYSYLQDIASPPPSLYFPPRVREPSFSELQEPHHSTPAPPVRRAKRKPAAAHSESSSDDGRPRPSPRRMPVPVRTPEPTIKEAGAQFIRVCHNSISRAVRNVFNSFMSYVSGVQDKRDVQMAMVICLVLVAGLIMFGLSDSRTVHHHHWEFFNPPDIPQ
ncbi:uncharacterized protein LOC119835486 isoform X1 [Zerene cesonia]|uniref:uncharacterized protein LOC119835486 isoform X1 n=2 Tax=Zerene cesonia TaxID=33412 RepID=UPI0018E5364E|nr:uncharacterized protein LOC119835486 isoform X1 [Zerene cesonia]